MEFGVVVEVVVVVNLEVFLAVDSIGGGGGGGALQVNGAKQYQSTDSITCIYISACLHSLWLLHFKEQCCQEMAKDDKLVDHLGKKKCLKETRRAKDLKEALERSRNPKKKSRELPNPTGLHDVFLSALRSPSCSFVVLVALH